MTLANSLLAAAIIMAIVFTVLAALFALVNLQTRIFGFMKAARGSNVNNVQPAVITASNIKEPEASSGELEITGLDERTAAMVMAIAADELKIPLNELKFKSITALD